MILHKTLAAGRWFTFSLIEQLANIDVMLNVQSNGENAVILNRVDKLLKECWN